MRKSLQWVERERGLFSTLMSSISFGRGISRCDTSLVR